MRAETRSRWSKTLALIAVTLMGGSLLLAAGLPALGTAYGLYEQSPSLEISANPGVPDQSVSGYEGSTAGVDYVAPLGDFVVSYTSGYGYGGSLLAVPPSGGPVSVQSHVCAGSLGGVYYPTSGSTIFTQCWVGTNQSVIVVANSTTLQPGSNVSLGSRLYVEQYAMDSANGRLYCLDYNGRLKTVDLVGHAVTANVSAPGGYGIDPLWFDTANGELITGDARNQSLLVVDPSTGLALSTTPLPGNVSALLGDPSRNQLYVAYGSDVGGPGRDGVAILNATSLAILTELPMPYWEFSRAFLDPRHGEVDLTNGYSVAVLNQSTDQLVGQLAYLQGGSGLVAFDSAGATYATVSDQGDQFEISLVTMSRSFTTPSPYSSFPAFGVQAPIDLGAIAFLTALGMLVVRRVLFHVPYEDLPPRFEEPELSGSPAEAAEAARQRWLAEDAKRGGPKP